MRNSFLILIRYARTKHDDLSHRHWKFLKMKKKNKQTNDSILSGGYMCPCETQWKFMNMLAVVVVHSFIRCWCCCGCRCRWDEIKNCQWNCVTFNFYEIQLILIKRNDFFLVHTKVHLFLFSSPNAHTLTHTQ